MFRGTSCAGWRTAIQPHPFKTSINSLVDQVPLCSVVKFIQQLRYFVPTDLKSSSPGKILFNRGWATRPLVSIPIVGESLRRTLVEGCTEIPESLFDPPAKLLVAFAKAWFQVERGGELIRRSVKIRGNYRLTDQGNVIVPLEGFTRAVTTLGMHRFLGGLLSPMPPDESQLHAQNSPFSGRLTRNQVPFETPRLNLLPTGRPRRIVGIHISVEALKDSRVESIGNLQEEYLRGLQPILRFVLACKAKHYA